MLYPNLGCKGIPARLRFLPLWGLLLSSASLFAQTGPILTLPTPPATVSAIGVIPNPDNNSYIQVTLSSITIVRYHRFGAPSMSRVTSCGLRITGSFFGAFTSGKSSMSMSRRRNVFLY